MEKVRFWKRKKVRIQKKVEDEEDSTIAESTADDTVIEGENIILASGSKPLILPIPGMDSERVLTSDALFAMKEAPKSLIIIGGGVISVEFATVYASLECKITILEAMPKLVPNMDKEISQNLKMILKKRGIDIHTSAAVQGVTVEGRDLYLSLYRERKGTGSNSRVCAVCSGTLSEYRWPVRRKCKTGYGTRTCAGERKLRIQYPGSLCNR